MDCFIYLSSIDFYVQLTNSEFFDVISEYASNDWTVSTQCKFDDMDLFIDFYAEKNHVKIEIGHLCNHNY